MTAILDTADDAFWWAVKRWRTVVPVIVGVVVVIVVVALVAGGGDKKSSIPSDAVATVGGSPITTAELDHWQAVFKKTSSTQTQSVTDAQARKGAFSMLAQEGWITQEAKRNDVSVSAAQISDAEQKLLSQYKGASKAQVLQQLGLSEDDLRMTQRTALLTTALQKKVTDALPKPSSSQIAAQYKSEPALWAQPSTRDARLLIAQSASAAQQAISAIKGGTTFSTVAKKYSVDPNVAQTGGAIKGVKPGSTGEAALEHAFFTAPLGQLEGPVKVGSGYAVFQVQKIVKSPAQSLQAASSQISQVLSANAQQKAVADYVKGVQDRWKAKTTCRPAVNDSSVCGGSIKA